jgi:hypothetical protein
MKKIFAWWRNYQSKWHPHLVRQCLGIDGNYLCGIVMRRKCNGAWQYRKMTDAEAAQDQMDNAW